MRTQATLILLAVLSLPAFAAPRTSAVDFAANPGNEKIEVIVQFDTTGKGNARSVAPQGQVTKEFSHFNGVVMSLPAKAVEALSKSPGVKYVSPNRKLQRKLEYAQPGVFADIAYSYGFTGAGVGVAVIDSGVTQHGDLYNGPVSRIVYSESFVPGTSVTADGYGHGSHVAGIIGGDATVSLAAGSTRKFLGIAPRANIINLRVLDNNGSGSDASVIAAIDRAIQLKSTYNIRVMNLSLGRP
ncbi:MAG: S8 family serine peptidase, partial [Bryobacterales bacterium]|nr:S8 family serine peptidase [Bryobacterales bacterium]